MHTQGPIQSKDWTLYSTHGVLEVIGYVATSNARRTAHHAANAARLAACWNACDGIATDSLSPFREAVRKLLSELASDNKIGIPQSHAAVQAANAVRAALEGGR